MTVLSVDATDGRAFHGRTCIGSTSLLKVVRCYQGVVSVVATGEKAIE
jgi:hypothetical protein